MGFENCARSALQIHPHFVYLSVFQVTVKEFNWFQIERSLSRITSRRVCWNCSERVSSKTEISQIFIVNAAKNSLQKRKSKAIFAFIS